MAKSLVEAEFVLADKEELFEKLRGDVGKVVARYCSVPDRYKESTLEGIKEPSPSQNKATQLFRLLIDGDERFCENQSIDSRGVFVVDSVGYNKHQPCPFRPKIGIYLFGPPGRGKTHLTYAYANALVELLDKQQSVADNYLKGEIDKLVSEATGNGLSLNLARKRMEEAQKTVQTAMRTTWKDMLDKVQRFYDKGLSHITGSMTGIFSRKDMFILDFDTLIELFSDNTAILKEAVEAPILIVDDVHFKGEKDRAVVMQDLLEKRYNAGRRATFINGNLDLVTLVNSGRTDPVLQQRLLSRCGEMFYPVDVSDAKDYRKNVVGADWNRIIDGIIG